METSPVSDDKENEIKSVEKEIKELQAELVNIAKEIKKVKDSETRKALFTEKKQIHDDIEDAKNHLAMLKGEDILMPTNESDEETNEELTENEKKNTENEH